MKLGHDGFGLMGEFGPDSMWEYVYDNPEDDAWADDVMAQMEGGHDSEESYLWNNPDDDAWGNELMGQMDNGDDPNDYGGCDDGGDVFV